MGVSELLQLLGDAIDDPEEGELDRLLKLHKVNLIKNHSSSSQAQSHHRILDSSIPRRKI